MEKFPLSEPYESGLLEVGDGHTLSWRQHGNPRGRPVVCLHGGPGSGCTPGWAQWFDPDEVRVVLFDQRGAGLSTPYAGEPVTDLSAVTTAHHVADIERLREHLGIDRWSVFGASWGSTLGLAYAQAHPKRVRSMVLYSVVTTTPREVVWVTQDMRRVFPEAWERLASLAPTGRRDDLVGAYHRLLMDPDPAVHEPAARAWCEWEDTHVDLDGVLGPSPRYEDPRFRLGFARQVTWAWSNAAFLPADALQEGAQRLAGIPGALVTGRADVSGPPDIAFDLAQRWPDAALTVVARAGHGRGGTLVETVLAEVARLV